MYQLVAVALGVAAGAFAWSGDPLVGFMFAVCAVVWLAVTAARRTFSNVKIAPPGVPEIH